MKIEWLGHASFKITGTKVIVTDPFEGIGFPFPAVRADVVTVSHGHHDHNAAHLVKGDPAVVDDAGKHAVSGVSITGYQTFHDDCKGAKRGGNLVFVIEMDGLKIAHLGDLGAKPDLDVMAALANVDVLLLPVGGNYTINGAQAAALTKQLSPRLVIPMHYKTPGLNVNVGSVEEFLTAMGEYTTAQESAVELRRSLSGVLVLAAPAV